MGKKLDKKTFIERSKVVHGNKYDYSKVEYKDAKTKVCIICPEHGEFWQIPSSHMLGFGCAECAGRRTFSTENWIKKAKKIHGDKYDYSKVNYINNRTKVCIICPIHGEFWQTSHDHLSGKGCIRCANKYKPTTEEWIKRAQQIHGNKYDYSKVEYENAHKKVCIICPKHGEFWQEPDNHLRWGCKSCCESAMEIKVKKVLSTNGINYETQKKFKWLKNKGKLSLDFYLTDINVAIECQGEQHFEPYRFEMNSNYLNKRKNRDKIKKMLCEQNGIDIIYYSETTKYDEFLGIKMVKNTKELLKKIKEYYGD